MSDISAAIDSGRPAVVLAGDEELPAGLDLPVKVSDQSIILPDGRRLEGSAGDGVAVLQIAMVDDRAVLVRQARSARLDGEFAAWLEDPDNLSSLTGVSAVWTGQGQPTSFGADGPSVATDGQRDDATGSEIPDSWIASVLLAVGAGLVVAVAVLIGILLRRRIRRTRTGSGRSDDDGN